MVLNAKITDPKYLCVKREESARSVIIHKLSWNFFVHAGRRLLVWFEQFFFFFFFCFILVNIWGTEASQRAFGAKMTSY